MENLEEITQRCRECEITKAFSFFSNKSGSKSGKSSRCKDCDSIHGKAYYQANKEKRKAESRQNYADNREDRVAQKRRYVAQNLDKTHASVRAYSRAHRSETSQQKKESHKNNPAKQMLTSAKSRAKRTGISFSLKLSDIVIPGKCPIFGTLLEVGTKKNHENSPSLDRVDSDFGYTPDNVAVISYRANRIKHKGTAEEHKRVADWMEGSFPIHFETYPATDHHAKYLLRGAKDRASKRNIPFDLRREHIRIPDVCPVLGIPLKIGQGRLTDASPTVDQIVLGVGYIPSNIAIISHRANIIKADGTAAEHRKIADWIDQQTVRIMD